MSSKMTRWRGIPMLAWIALIAALTGAGVLIDGISPRAAWAQVGSVRDELPRQLCHDATAGRAIGNAAPLRIISGPATGLANPAGLAVDTVNNEILVANISSITVYSLTASGNVAPLRTISGVDTELAQPIGLAVDTVNNEVLVANDQLHHGLQPDRGRQRRPAAGPSAERQTGLLNPAGLAVDTVNNEILVANIGSSDARQLHHGLQPDCANGNVAPLRTHQRSSHGVGSADRSRGGHGEQRDPGREQQLHHGPQPDRGRPTSRRCGPSAAI